MARKRAEEVPPPDLEAFAERVGHRFARPELLRQALTHRSAADPRRDQLDSNERLEFIGDRVLGLLMAEWLAERFPEEREGELGRRLSALVAWDSLAKVAEALDIGAVLLVPAGENRAGLTTRQNVLADALEALLGALYLDGGLDAARILVRREWEAMVGADLRPPKPAKSRLQEWMLGRGLGLPEYQLVSAAGPSHLPLFVVSVSVAGREAEGMGASKRAAEEMAAEAWLAGLAKPGPTKP
ncbi:ribonuclease III [Siccirubricoccus sp. G192]|uniref:ribonuclease III n=1 Tax=Siccirubricoccus sp. G192 TaxID=2849651 RepID=UPI001C2C3E1B|nr:ribonuclease III [Siccirubricoccus sp. G192]MBV1798828.1 ribonuclease III [Siccirubricoccus sp. G192]